jgi:gas vesicle protein
MILRFLFGFLLGTIIGSAATAFFLSSGGGDYLIATSPRVRQLEEDLRKSSQEEQYLAKRFEDFATLMEKLEARFVDLEKRFEHVLEESGKDVGESSAAGQGELSPSL